MAVNIKIGNNTLTGVNTVEFTDATDTSVKDSFISTSNAQTKTTTFSGNGQSVTPDSGKYLTSVTINKPSNLIPENIKKDVTIAGVIGTHEGGGIEGGYNVTMSVDSSIYQITSTVSGGHIAQPADPTNKIIEGWYTGSGYTGKVSFPYTPASNTTLYGKVIDAYRTLNDNTWAIISFVSGKGTAANYWSVGDCKQITLNGTAGSLSLSNENVYVYILDFAHNTAKEGTGISFGGFKVVDASKKDIALVDSGYSSSKSSGTWFNMNNTSSNTGGWKASRMRYYALGSTNTNGGNATSTTATSPVSSSLMSCLPSDLRAVMKPITKFSDNTGGGSDTASYVTSTVDYLPLLSEFEVFGTRSYANSAERNYQTQYTYYVNGNSKVKYKHTDGTTACGWWLRSVSSSAASGFCYVRSSGSAYSISAYCSYGVAPAFLI